MSTDGTGGGSTLRNKDSDEYEKIKVTLEGKMEKKDEEIIKIEANVFQLANYYFVFQGVILTCILKDSSTTIGCKYIWLPLSLSITAGILNLGALLIMGGKYKESLQLLDIMAKMLHGHKHKGREASVVALARATHAQSQAERSQTRALQEAVAQARAALELATQAHPKAPADTHVLADALTRARGALTQATSAHTQAQAQPLAPVVASALARVHAALDLAAQAHPQAPANTHVLADALARARGALTQATSAHTQAQPQPLAPVVASALARVHAALDLAAQAHPQASEISPALAPPALTQATLADQAPQAARAQPQAQVDAQTNAHVRIPTSDHTLALAVVEALDHAHAALAQAAAAEAEHSSELERAVEKARGEARRSASAELAEVNKKHEMKEFRRTCILVLSMTLLVLFGILNLIASVIVPCRI